MSNAQLGTSLAVPLQPAILSLHSGWYSWSVFSTLIEVTRCSGPVWALEIQIIQILIDFS